MQKSLISIALCSLCACSTPPDRGSNEPAPITVLDNDGGSQGTQDAGTPDAAARRPRQPPAMPVIQTFEGWAERLGVHLDIFLLASMSCTRLINCGWWSPPPECPAATTEAWCKNGGCDDGIFPGPYDYEGHPCAADVYDRPCTEISRPVVCEELQRLGSSFRMTDGAPAGGWPVNPGHNGPPPPDWPK